jgi:hypothetical protein
MASITKAKLTISKTPANGTALCTVDCTVSFSSYEMGEMKKGLKFRLDCSLWGEDLGNWLNPDDFIFNYTSKFFPDATPTSSENYQFKETLGLGLLNEDPSLLFPTDEVYGLLTLKNLYTQIKVQKKTNVVTGNF